MRFNTYKQQLLFCGTKGLARPEPRLGFWWPCCFLSVTSCLASCRGLIRTPSSHRLISHSTNFLTLRNERGQSWRAGDGAGAAARGGRRTVEEPGGGVCVWWGSEEAQRKFRKPQRVSGELWIGLERKENKTNPNALCFLGGQTVISPSPLRFWKSKRRIYHRGGYLTPSTPLSTSQASPIHGFQLLEPW